MTLNNANRKDIRAAEKEAALAETNRIAYTRTIMSTTFGRAWMWDLLESCYMFHSPMVMGFPDGTGVNIGKQDVGRKYYDIVVSNCPAEFALMMSEASTKEAVNERRFDDNNPAGSTGSSRRWNPAEPSQYRVDADGFVSDQSGADLDDGGNLEGEDPFARQPEGNYTVR